MSRFDFDFTTSQTPENTNTTANACVSLNTAKPMATLTLRPTVVSVYNYVQPIVAVSVSVAIGLAVFKLTQALAVVLVFSGVWLVVKSKSKRDMTKN